MENAVTFGEDPGRVRIDVSRRDLSVADASVRTGGGRLRPISGALAGLTVTTEFPSAVTGR